MTRQHGSNRHTTHDGATPQFPYDPKIVAQAQAWTEIAGDLQGVDPRTAEAIRRSRYLTAVTDAPRAALWQDPEGIDAFTDIDYSADHGDADAAPDRQDTRQTVRGHLLDVYLPHDAVVRGGHTTPVYIDIHGGGFSYGYKELNRNFNTHLAHEGFGVISLNYRPAPQTDLRGQLSDIQQALAWVRGHLSDYPLNPGAVFITGDSAGATLALLTLAIENSPDAARAFGIETPSGLRIIGGTLVSGLFNLMRPHSGTSHKRTIRTMLEQTLGSEFFAGLDAAAPYLTPEGVVHNVNLPPLLLNTSSDDFLQDETLALATALARSGADFQVQDWKVGRLDSTLGHVFPVCMTWLEESRRTLRMMRDFSYARA